MCLTINIKKFSIGFILMVFSIVGMTQSIPILKSEVVESRNGKSFYVHVVKKGQTIYAISKSYDVTPEELYFENPESRDAISVNQILYIPTVNKETEINKEIGSSKFNFFYHVSDGNETFASLSDIYSVPDKYIKKANPKVSLPFREGEYIKIPVEESFSKLDDKLPIINNRNSEKHVTADYHENLTNKTEVKNEYAVGDEFISFNPDILIIIDYRHVVVAGETTQSIALKYDVSASLLKAVNLGLGNTVLVGDRLRVPDKSKLVKSNNEVKNIENNIQPESYNNVINPTLTTKTIYESAGEYTRHEVIKKQTLYSIGREYGLTVEEILNANPGLTNQIKVGQIILIPRKKLSLPYIIYISERSTKINKIAKLFQISSYQLRDFNPNLNSRVKEGEEVRIPVGSKAIIEPVAYPSIESSEEFNTEEEKVVEILNSHNCNFIPDTNKLYKVALMIPLSLEEIDSLDYDQFFLTPQPYFKSFRFIQFYEGALIAMDSIVKQGMNVEMYVYDVDKNLTKTTKVLNKKELRTMDLIIGPFFNNSFNQVALYAGNFNIPIVNPLTYRDAVVTNYKTVIKVRPTTTTQEPLLETYLGKFALSNKVFLISQTSYLDADKVTNIKNGIASVIPDQISISNNELMNLSYEVAQRDTLYVIDSIPPPFTFENREIFPEFLESNLSDSSTFNNNLIKINYSVDSLYPFLKNASALRNNLVILYGTKKSFILDVLNRINESRDTFNVNLIGIPTWERISNLSNSKMNNLNLTYFSSSYIDYKLPRNKHLISTFRNAYGTEPNNYGFSGFDVTYYFLNALFHLDNNLGKCLEYYPMTLTQGEYSFTRTGSSDNFVNNYWHILQLKKMRVIKLPDAMLETQTISNLHE